VKSAIAAASSAAADVQLAPGDTLTVGSLQLVCLATPGHTNGCMCFYLPGAGSRTGMVFTGKMVVVVLVCVCVWGGCTNGLGGQEGVHPHGAGM
jgi:glyoxylase-like metal-dependent hydrolase (beta-lactamase superfamily II)